MVIQDDIVHRVVKFYILPIVISGDVCGLGLIDEFWVTNGVVIF